MDVDTEINAKPAQAEAGVGAGAELGNSRFICLVITCADYNFDKHVCNILTIVI